MTMRESTNRIKGVSETLMITLYARAIETQRPHGILKDPKAVELIEKLDYDFSKYDRGWKSQLGTILRSKTLDLKVTDFIRRHPDAVLVNLGSGLCTRFFRLDNGTIRWYEVDLPPVIELRKQLLAETDRYQFIAGSILDLAWIDRIERKANQPLLIILEGVSMYLSEAENRMLLHLISHYFSPAEMYFDVLSPAAAKTSKTNDTITKTTAEFKWGIANAQDFRNWGINVLAIEEDYYVTHFADYPHLPWGLKTLLSVLIHIPSYKNLTRLVWLRLGSQLQN